MTNTDPKSLQAESDAEHFAAMRAQSRIRELPLTQIFSGIEAVQVEIGAIDPDTKHANQVDMIYVCAIARHVMAKRIFEFGTYLGRTTYHLAMAECRPTVFTLDLDPAADRPKGLKLGQAVRSVLDSYQGVFFRDTEAAGRIVQLHGDSRRFDYSAWRGNIDFIFIDAGHTYEFVANDTDKAFQMLARGGIVVWHDYAPKSRDVVAFARELSRTRPLFWVRDTSLLVYIDGSHALQHDAVVPPWAREKLKPG